MCGRYTNETEFSQIRLLFQAIDGTFRTWTPKYNISPSSGPGYEQLIVTADRPGTRQIRLARFWLIPSFWSRPLSELPTTFNARSEDLAQKRTWREPFRHGRCLVPATGWREFTGRASPKQPYHFRPEPTPGAQPTTFAFAGLHSEWASPEGEVIDSFAIVTTQPSPAAAAIHDRMPLLVPQEHWDDWLFDDAEREQVLGLAQASTQALRLEVYPSDPVANSVHYEGALAIQRVEPHRSVAPERPVSRGRRPPPGQLSWLDPPPKARRKS